MWAGRVGGWGKGRSDSEQDPVRLNPDMEMDSMEQRVQVESCEYCSDRRHRICLF